MIFTIEVDFLSCQFHQAVVLSLLMLMGAGVGGGSQKKENQRDRQPCHCKQDCTSPPAAVVWVGINRVEAVKHTA